MATQRTWPPAFFGSSSACGVAGVVMVARVRRVDGDQRQVAQILAALEAGGLRRVGLGDHLVGEVVGDAVLVDGDQRDGSRRGRIAQTARRCARAAGPCGPSARPARPRPARHPARRGWRRRRPAIPCRCPLSMGRIRPPSAPLRKMPSILHGLVPMRADQPRLVMVRPRPATACRRGEDAVARPQRGIATPRGDQRARLRPLAVPFQRAGEQVAVGASAPVTCSTQTGGRRSGSR